ncbi:MAG TPA: hypothetical protein PLK94_01375 [Alphaproteobacteria bacterium]|nr:hypothetical protein [Alphaproteobacteria bacterium]
MISKVQDSPAMGERRARWGYGYQDKIATERIVNLLRKSVHAGVADFEGVRLADLDAGRVDDFVLVWDKMVEGNSIKWSGDATPFNWGDFIGAHGLLSELAEGYRRLKNRWPDKVIVVRLQSNRPPSLEKHHAQLVSSFSVAEFIREYWFSGPTDNDSVEVATVWSIIAEHVGLTGAEFIMFVKSCTLELGYPEPPGNGTDSQDWRHYKKQFDDLHKAIAIWLTNNPRSDFIDRKALLAAIGYHSYRTGLIQRFPPPQIPYSKNEASAEKLKKLIETTEGGYIAVVGSAGIGKSTLVQDVLSNDQYPYFVPYYAFLPEIDGNRERGEALTFFQDTVGRFDKFFTGRYSLGISDIAQGREAFREHMARANKEYILQGKKTILLIDGLDHVSKEINLQNTLLQELPDPTEIPSGFLIILSSQPQALIPGIIVASVGNAVTSEDRKIFVSGLSRPEVHTILEKADKETTHSERDALSDACLGNPLILTYLLKIFQRSPEITIKEAIALGGNYEGDIAKYYQSSLSTSLQDSKTRRLLGLLCRAAPTIPVRWLQDWPERDNLEDLIYRLLAPFMQEEAGNLKFIHNSLIAFLKSETRSKIPGADLSVDERSFHSILADRCGDRSCVDPLGRAKVQHLLHSGRVEELLNLLAPPLSRETQLRTEPSSVSSDWLRQAIEAFIPYTFIYPLLLSGLEAAWKLDKLGEVLRLILLDHEFSQRTSRLEAGDLAEKFLALDKPELALAQIRAGGRLLVDDSVGLDFSLSLWFYAFDHNRDDLKKAAQTIYFQAKPIALFYQHEPIDTFCQHDYHKNLRSWSDAAPLFEEPGSIITQIRKLRFEVQRSGANIDEPDTKARLLHNVLLTMLDCDADGLSVKMIVDEIRGMGLPNWQLATLLTLAKKSASYVSTEDLKTAYSELRLEDSDLDLAYAQMLYARGCSKEAKEIVSRLVHVRFDGYQNIHNFGFSDISYTVALKRLQDLLELPQGPVPDVKDDTEEAIARVERTSREIGILLAAGKMRKPIPDLRDCLRSLLLFHNRAVKFPQFDWRRNYAVTQAKKEIHSQIMRLTTSFGIKGLELLKDVLLELVNGPASSQFSAHHRRYFAMELFHKNVLSKEQAVEFGLSSTSDAIDDDPMQRQEACFEIASFLYSLGANALSEHWLKRAGEVSAGAGSHKDYHMASLADWLSRSIRPALDADQLKVLDKFARAVEVAGGDGSAEAAMEVLQSLIHVEPIRAFRLAVELIDRGVLNVSQTINSLILGGAKAGISGELMVAIYDELLSLINPGNTSAAAVACLRCFPVDKRILVAKKMIGTIRTNALPSIRIEIVRALQDALRKDELGDYVFTQGLKTSHDDSSRKSELYKQPNGELETIECVAARLSNYANPEQWNLNPAENSEFNWWAAIKKAKIKDVDHLNTLLSSFTPPEYREVELLVWKSEWLWKLGDHKKAKLLAEQAIERAKDSSWHRWLDGAQKKTAYSALKKIDVDESLKQAREQFGNDLIAGKLNSTYLLSDIVAIMDFLELEWPSDYVCKVINDYLDYVLAANAETRSYISLTDIAENGSGDEALCRLLIQLLAFPVIDVGVAVRKALSSYAVLEGKGLIETIIKKPCWDSVQLEHILVCLHTGLRGGNVALKSLQNWIVNLNKHESIAVRAIARRICDEQEWQWTEIRNQIKQPVILVPTSLKSPTDYKEASLLVDGDIVTGTLLHQRIFTTLERAGLNAEELESEFYRIYKEVEKKYSWTDEKRRNRWIKLVLARHWLHPRGIIGREAAMRVFGRRALVGDAPPGGENAYDYIYPIYDPVLDLSQPIERPVELNVLNDELWNERGKAWLRGENADSWNNYPDSINGLHLIGERSWFIRPDWEWPREERHCGLIIGRCEPDETRECLQTSRELTFDLYLQGKGQENGQLVVLNSERQLVGSTYRWAAINSKFARALNWQPSDGDPFKWVDADGNLMVKSVYWKDGWIWLEPPRFESLGEGWLVLATEHGLKTIRAASNYIDCRLWIERHCDGDKPYEGKWHLSKRL